MYFITFLLRKQNGVNENLKETEKLVVDLFA